MEGLMAQRTINASAFKAKCLGLLDEVATTGETIVVTKRGRAVAKLAPVDDPPSLLGSVTYNVSEEELLAPIDELWDVDRE
jgi:prevent-host-death family protein